MNRKCKICARHISSNHALWCPGPVSPMKKRPGRITDTERLDHMSRPSRRARK